MIRTVASWYSLLVGVVVCVLPMRWLELASLRPAAAAVSATVFVAAGLLLIAGALARIMRLPGRNAAIFYGFGAGTIALGLAAARLAELSAPMWQLTALGALGVLLVFASWSLWPSGA